MKILVLQIEKSREEYLETGLQLYLKRLGSYARLEIHTINVPKNVRQRAVPEQKETEGKLALNALEETDFLVVLDEKGRELTSAEFAEFIVSRQNVSTRRLVFLVGGPYGFSDAVYNRADYKLSLSRMTFSHQMVRLFFVEQLYRAFTIIKGEKYHHP